MDQSELVREYRLMLQHARQALVDLLGDVEAVLDKTAYSGESSSSGSSILSNSSTPSLVTFLPYTWIRISASVFGSVDIFILCF